MQRGVLIEGRSAGRTWMTCCATSHTRRFSKASRVERVPSRSVAPIFLRDPGPGRQARSDTPNFAQLPADLPSDLQERPPEPIRPRQDREDNGAARHRAPHRHQGLEKAARVLHGDVGHDGVHPVHGRPARCGRHAHCSRRATLGPAIWRRTLAGILWRSSRNTWVCLWGLLGKEPCGGMADLVGCGASKSQRTGSSRGPPEEVPQCGALLTNVLSRPSSNKLTFPSAWLSAARAERRIGSKVRYLSRSVDAGTMT